MSQKLTAILRVSSTGRPRLTRAAGAWAYLLDLLDHHFLELLKGNAPTFRGFQTCLLGSEIPSISLEGVECCEGDPRYRAIAQDGSVGFHHERLVAWVFAGRISLFVCCFNFSHGDFRFFI